MLAVAAVLLVHTTFAQNAAVHTPVQLVFDAASAPKNCNDQVEFGAILGRLFHGDMFSRDTSPRDTSPRDTLPTGADRRLDVRIRRSPTGGKLVDVTLTDAAGTLLGEHHERYGVKIECHKILDDTADASAHLLGAFEKPPAPEPCPVCPLASPVTVRAPCPVCVPCPTCPAPQRFPQIAQGVLISRRPSFGAGVFFGTGITAIGAVGQHFSVGFVPWIQFPRLHVEIDGAWAPQTLPTGKGLEVLHVNMIPVAGSLCYSRDVLRLCGGLAGTFFSADDSAPGGFGDEQHTKFATHVRMGTEFEITHSFSIRMDFFGLLRFAQYTTGNALTSLDELPPLAGGMAVMGVWSIQ